MSSFNDFFLNLANPFLLRPFLTSIILAAVCGFIGVFVILRKMVFMVDGIAHSGFAGGALAVLMVWNPLLTIGLFSMSTAITMGVINEKGKLTNETAIGVMFAFAMAIGIIFIGMIKTYTTGISSLLFGSIVTITLSEFIILMVVSIVVLAALFFLEKELFILSFDEELAKANGVAVRKVSYIFLLLVSAVVIICMKSIGVILLLALIVTPAATAYQLTYNIRKMVVYSGLIGMVGAFIGFIWAYIQSLAASAMIVVVLTLIFLGSMVLSPKRRMKKNALDEDKCEICSKIINSAKQCPFCEDSNLETHLTHDEIHSGAFDSVSLHEGHNHSHNQGSN
jgi:ABC-type Mn2+/Zn2+ transport system permease subunit